MSEEYKSIPVAVARAAVQESGLLEGFQGPEYWAGLDDRMAGPPWLPMFAPTDERPHPEFARAIITRKGQAPREVVISWDEYAAELEIDDPDWLEKRTQKPMAIFGAEVERHAYRVVFADVLANLEKQETVRVLDAHGLGPRGRDWAREVASAASLQDLNGLYDEARDEHALKMNADLQAAFTRRLAELTRVTAPAPKPSEVPHPVKPEALSRPNRGGGKGQTQRRKRRPRPLTQGLAPEDAEKLAALKAGLPSGGR